MNLVSGRELLTEAGRGGWAVGAFNFSNLELLQAIIGAAGETRTPVFLSTSEGAIRYAGLDNIVALCRTAAARIPVPVSLHLDHGRDFALIAAAVKSGYTSVMIDASHLPYEENVRQTSAVVALAHPAGVSVEAELGRLVGVEDTVSTAAHDAVLIDPDEAGRFVAATGVDSLAPAIGTAHGAFKFKGEPALDLDRLRAVRRTTGGIPLVLHGASSIPAAVLDRCRSAGMTLPGAKGVPENQLRQAVRLGVCKVNVDTDLRLAFTAELRHVLRDAPGEFDLRNYLSPARTAVQTLVRDRILLLRNP